MFDLSFGLVALQSPETALRMEQSREYQDWRENPPELDSEYESRWLALRQLWGKDDRNAKI